VDSGRIDIPSTVKKAHYFFIVDGGLFLELFFLVQSSFLVPYQWLIAVFVSLAAAMNILFVGVFETALRKMNGVRDAGAVIESGNIPEKVAILDLWLQIGKLRLAVFLSAILVNFLSAVYLYHLLAT
jgi:hypothetical protein